MDFVRGFTVWGVSGSCRHLTPENASLGLGSRQILPAARCAPDLRGEVGAVWRMKTGVLARLLVRRIRCVDMFAAQLAARSVAGGLCVFFLLCAGWSLKWASLQDRLGCSGAPLPAFPSQDCSTLVSFL